jgi:hypothetical protein
MRVKTNLILKPVPGKKSPASCQAEPSEKKTMLDITGRPSAASWHPMS